MNGKILVTDDERLTRNGLQRTLIKWAEGRYDILTAEDGWAALQLLRQHDWRFELLITDIRMPGMDGLQLIKHAKEEGNELSAILLTGYAEFEYARTAIRHGAIDYLLKPVQEDLLIRAVEEGLERTAARRDGASAGRGDEREGGESAAHSDVANPFIRQAMELIDRHLEQPLTAKDVAGRVHLNVSYFSVLFKNEAGVTFSDYLTNKRLERAKEMLVKTDRKVYEIAEQTGYQSASYFVKVFQEAEGVTPKQYRDTNR
jgi:YesN/AraC family two-component response regulator